MPGRTSSSTSRTDAQVLKLVYVLRGPRGASYGLLRTADHPELLLAVNLHGFLRRTPFDGVLFKIEGGKLMVVAAWRPG